MRGQDSTLAAAGLSRRELELQARAAIAEASICWHPRRVLNEASACQTERDSRLQHPHSMPRWLGPCPDPAGGAGAAGSGAPGSPHGARAQGAVPRTIRRPGPPSLPPPNTHTTRTHNTHTHILFLLSLLPACSSYCRIQGLLFDHFTASRAGSVRSLGCAAGAALAPALPSCCSCR